MFFRYLMLLIFKTSEQQLDLLLEAIFGHNTCKEDKQEQLRTIHQSRKGFKRGQSLVLGTQTQKNAKNGTIVEKTHLSKDLYYNTQKLYARYILIE
jgi:hypothetical protein